MDFKETYEEKIFDKSDIELITEIKKKDKTIIKYLFFGFIVFSLVLSIIPDRNGNKMLEEMSFFTAIILVTFLFVILFGIPLLIYMIRKSNDYRNGKKIVIETQIKKLKYDKKDLKISLSNSKFNSKFNSKWIFVYRDKIYPGIAENDTIMISYLPKTRFVLELKKR